MAEGSVPPDELPPRWRWIEPDNLHDEDDPFWADLGEDYDIFGEDDEEDDEDESDEDEDDEEEW